MTTKPTTGMRVLIEETLRSGTTRFVATVTWVEEKELGWYYGYQPAPGQKRGSFGATWERHVPLASGFGSKILRDLGPLPKQDETVRPFGTQGWMVGHPGYDPK